MPRVRARLFRQRAVRPRGAAAAQAATERGRRGAEHAPDRLPHVSGLHRVVWLSATAGSTHPAGRHQPLAGMGQLPAVARFLPSARVCRAAPSCTHAWLAARALAAGLPNALPYSCSDQLLRHPRLHSGERAGEQLGGARAARDDQRVLAVAVGPRARLCAPRGRADRHDRLRTGASRAAVPRLRIHGAHHLRVRHGRALYAAAARCQECVA
mmetsp:Transcript_19032/g.49106  ORF Transcript_19032/g.49106 Transcript_19032/m.49106 type:complete len:212 (-) Transcript_19032:113-748(-)